MAIFKKQATAKAEPKKAVEKVASGAAQKAGKELDLAMVLVRPHVTEKASDLSEKGVYVFEIHKLANKMHVRQAVEKLFKVKPVKVSVVVGIEKLMRNRHNNRVEVKKHGVKKAYVYLKEGDKIEFV